MKEDNIVPKELEQFIPSMRTVMPELLPSAETLAQAEKLLSFRFSGELYAYLKKFGALSFSFVELNGINERQKEKSDMIRATLSFREIYPRVAGNFVVLEDMGDEDYILCDEKDEIFRYIPSLPDEYERPVTLGVKLFGYILNRYREVNHN